MHDRVAQSRFRSTSAFSIDADGRNPPLNQAILSNEHCAGEHVVVCTQSEGGTKCVRRNDAIASILLAASRNPLCASGGCR